LPVRVLDANGRGNTFLLSFAIEWASQQPGVEVINLSLGTPYDSKILREAIANVLAQGIVVVAAAGNDGVQTIQYPAGYSDVVGVTALDANNQKPEFANYGGDWIDIAAPGVGIMSTMINEQGAGYASWSGTSMATAFVSSAAALVEGQVLARSGPNEPTPVHLINTGVIIDSLNPNYAGQLGRLLNVSAALSVHEMILYIPYSRR
jgi:thermitase